MGLENLKTVFFIGTGYEDILLYLIAVLKVLGLKALVRDCTEKHSFYSCIRHVGGIDPEIYVLDISGAYYEIKRGDGGYPSSETMENVNNPGPEYNVLFKLYDVETYKEDAETDAEPLIVAVTDERRRNIEAFENAWLKRCTVLIVRDYTGVKEKRINGLLEEMKCEEVYALPVSERDRKTRIKAEYSEKYTFTGISGELEGCVTGLVKLIAAGWDGKEIKRAIKIAKRGGLK